MGAFSLSPPARRLAAALAGLALCGCVDTAAQIGASAPNAARPRLAALPGVSPRGAPVELASVEGPPPAAVARFREAFQSAAAARDVAIADAGAASYRIRGYLTAAGAAGATRLSYVWDIYDRNGKRLQRIADDLAARPGVEGWDGLDEKAMAEISRAGAQELAAFLSNTPEAVAAAQGAAAGASVVARGVPPAAPPQDSPALGFAQSR
jgi:hypothetical protein